MTLRLCFVFRKSWKKWRLLFIHRTYKALEEGLVSVLTAMVFEERGHERRSGDFREIKSPGLCGLAEGRGCSWVEVGRGPLQVKFNVLSFLP